MAYPKDWTIDSSRFIYSFNTKKNQELPLSWNSNQLSTWTHKCHLKGGWLAPFGFCHLLLCLIRAWTGVHPTKWIANFTKYPLCCGGIINFTEFYYGMYFSKFGVLGLCKDCRNFLFVIEIASAPSNLKVRLALKSKVIFNKKLYWCSQLISNLRYNIRIQYIQFNMKFKPFKGKWIWTPSFRAR